MQIVCEDAGRAINFGVCTVEGCGKRPRSRTADHCEAHYYRIRRNGTLDTIERMIEPALEHQHGYLLEYAPDHPLTTKGQQRVYEHRKVFYDEHGPGPFACHVCNATVTWADMHVDHLDDDPRNNRIDNLAPACGPCNQARGRHKMIATNRAAGRQITAFGKTACLSVWARDTGIPKTTLARRLKEGWSPERAVSTSPGPTGRKAPASNLRT